jgi:hypothetical protein
MMVYEKDWNIQHYWYKQQVVVMFDGNTFSKTGGHPYPWLTSAQKKIWKIKEINGP